jgi:GNAT superfamily N-acetyltransferase
MLTVSVIPYTWECYDDHDNHANPIITTETDYNDLTISATDDGKEVGLAYLRVENGNAYFSQFSVDLEYRSKGIGRKILLAAIESARQIGACKVTLSAMSSPHSKLSDSQLDSFYMSEGFNLDSDSSHTDRIRRFTLILTTSH